MMTEKQKEEVLDFILVKNSYLSRNEITEESRLFLDLDLDDLDFVDLLMDLDIHFQISIPDDILFEVTTIGGLFNALDKLV